MKIQYSIIKEGSLFNASDVEAITRKQVKGTLEMLTKFLEGEIKQATPVGATGVARRSVKGSVTSDLEAVISNDVEYAEFIETGTRPHFPSQGGQTPEALLLWIERKDWFPRNARPGMTLAQRGKALSWFIYKYGTSKKAQSEGNPAGPTGGTGWWPFAKGEAKMNSDVVQKYLEPLGISLAKELTGE